MTSFAASGSAVVREMDRQGQPIAVICHAPWLLISAGIIRGRALTSYHTIEDDIHQCGWKLAGREVVAR